MTVAKGDLVQVNLDGQDGWIGCVLEVSDVRAWGIIGFVKIPCRGNAYLRVDHAHYIKVGKSVVIEHRDDDKITHLMAD